MLCFLDFQVTGDCPNNRIYHVMERLESLQDAQSASEKACNLRRSEAFSKIPCVTIVAIERSVWCNASKCEVRGACMYWLNVWTVYERSGRVLVR